MDTKEDAEPPSSPIAVLQHLSGQAARVAGEALQSVYAGSPRVSSRPPISIAHRRTQSEVVNEFQRSNSFQKLKSHVQKACRWVGGSRDGGFPSSFNPEVLANQKRQWYQLHSKTMDLVNFKEPTSLFEHFVIVGLHPDTDLQVVEDAFAERKKWERKEMEKYEFVDYKKLKQQGPPVPTLEPQILFKYPPGKRLMMGTKDLASFCFPTGVKAELLERTPSLSDLSKLVYGQEHLGRDDVSFLFSVKAGDNGSLYGVCLHVHEIVQRSPGILGSSSPHPISSGLCSRFLVSAPRCYCLLTRVPFFELHFAMLNSLIAQERLNRITQVVTQMTLTNYNASAPKLDDQMSANGDSPERDSDWMACAIPLDDAVAVTAAAAGIICDDKMPQVPPEACDTQSPEGEPGSDASSDHCQVRDLDEEDMKNLQCHGDCSFEETESYTDAEERMYGNQEDDHTSPEARTPLSSQSCVLECDSNFSPVRSMALEDEDDHFANSEREYGDERLMKWARENKNDLLQIVCGYHALPLPPRGSELVFQPLEHLQAIEFSRPSVAALGFDENYLNCFDPSQVGAKLAASEEALALSLWATATACRFLSLGSVSADPWQCSTVFMSVLALVAGVLLEKQVVLMCPNLGVLSASVLSVVPMIRPFQWQSLLLPVLPDRMVDFIDAPVPYIVGIQHNPVDMKMKAPNLIHVNVLRDHVKLCHLPGLPKHRQLFSQLGPIHARLSSEGSVAKRQPVYRCSEAQAEAAMDFLNVLRNYFESLCSDLRSHSITSVQSNSDRVSLLLKDSFVGSFPVCDRPFIKLFVDTQMFTVLSDSRLTSFEHDYP